MDKSIRCRTDGERGVRGSHRQSAVPYLSTTSVFSVPNVLPCGLHTVLFRKGHLNLLKATPSTCKRNEAEKIHGGGSRRNQQTNAGCWPLTGQSTRFLEKENAQNKRGCTIKRQERFNDPNQFVDLGILIKPTNRMS